MPPDCDVEIEGDLVPLRLEQKRMAPGQTNSWYFEALGTEGGVRFNAADANSIFLLDYQNGQSWNRLNLGHAMTFPVITGGIFGAGFRITICRCGLPLPPNAPGTWAIVLAARWWRKRWPATSCGRPPCNQTPNTKS